MKMKYYKEDTGLKLTLENFVQYHGMNLSEFYRGVPVIGLFAG